MLATSKTSSTLGTNEGSVMGAPEAWWRMSIRTTLWYPTKVGKGEGESDASLRSAGMFARDRNLRSDTGGRPLSSPLFLSTFFFLVLSPVHRRRRDLAPARSIVSHHSNHTHARWLTHCRARFARVPQHESQESSATVSPANSGSIRVSRGESVVRESARSG